MSLSNDVLKSILKWDSLPDNDPIKYDIREVIREILHVPGGYTTNDILSKICKPEDVAATDYPKLHRFNRECSMLPVLCRSPVRLTKFLDCMVKDELIEAVDLGPEDDPLRHYYRPAKNDPLDVTR